VLSEDRIFFAGIATSFVCLAIVTVLGQEPHRPRVTPDPSAQLSIFPVSAATSPIGWATELPAQTPASAPVEPATEVQSDIAVASAPVKPTTEMKADTPVEATFGIESPTKKSDLKSERRKRQADARTKRLVAQRARRAQQGLRAMKLLDQR